MSTGPDQFAPAPASAPAAASPAAAPPAGRDMLNALRSDRPTIRDAAVRQFIDDVTERTERMARKMLGAKAGRIDLDPNSVIISVLGRDLEKLVEASVDDRHLIARTLTAIRHRYIDRLRARKDVNPDSRNASGDHTTFDTPSPDDGPGTIVADFEQSIAEQEANTLLVTRLALACKSDDDRTMVEQFLLRDQSWSAIAGQIGKSEGAAKTAFSRLRRDLLAAVMLPLKAKLDADDWIIVQTICVDRRALPEAAAAIGGTPASVLAKFRTRIFPAIRDEYGAAGLMSLIPLIGKIRTE